MDVLQLLDNELKTKSNWNLEEKAKHLYTRSCELFSYDERYKNIIFRKMYGPEKLRDEILLKEIDLRNVTDFLVVCTSYSKYVYKTLLKELLSIESTVPDGDHAYNLFEINKDKYKADATGECDIVRVKMKLRTEGWHNLNIGSSIDSRRIEQIDKKTEYIKDEYFEEKLERRINNLEWEYYNVTGKYDDYDEVSYLLFQIDTIKKLFDEIAVFKHYSDAFYCIEYLIDKFFGGVYYVFKYNFLKNTSLLDITSNGDWNFINILDIKYREEKFSFVLEPIDGKYEFREIPINEGEHYKKELLNEKDFLVQKN